MSRIIQPPEIKGHPWIVRDADTGTILAQVALERDARLLAESDKILMTLARVLRCNFKSDGPTNSFYEEPIFELLETIIGEGWGEKIKDKELDDEITMGNN